ncbi:MAG: hypothetical protein WCP06_13235 [Verrucomicrobiota bacterium]
MNEGSSETKEQTAPLARRIVSTGVVLGLCVGVWWVVKIRTAPPPPPTVSQSATVPS